MAERVGPIPLKFPLGVNNRAPETALPTDDNGLPIAVREGVNVDFFAQGNWARRPGYTQVTALTFGKSLWSAPEMDFALYVDDGALKRLNADQTSTDLSTAVSRVTPLSYAWQDGVVYFTDNTLVKKLVDGVVSEWGMPVPPSPVLTATTGLAKAGDYQVTWTYLSADGEESGAPPAALITLTDHQAINVTAPASSYDYRIYVTPCNGDKFYYAGVVSGGSSFVISGDPQQSGRLLRTHLGQRPIPGKIVRPYKGRLLIANGEVVWFSEPTYPGIFYPRTGFLLYESEVALIGVQTSGLFVGTRQRTYWLAGDDPTAFRQVVAHPYGAIAGTETLIPADWYGGSQLEDVGFSPCWRDTEGVLCIGRPNGLVQRINAEHLHLTNYNFGAQVPMVRNGMEQVLASLWQQEGEVVGFGDTVVAEVVQHGLS